MKHLGQRVNARGAWRRLPLAALNDLILATQRDAVDRHLADHEWRQLDRMRRHRASLLKEGAHGL